MTSSIEGTTDAEVDGDGGKSKLLGTQICFP